MKRFDQRAYRLQLQRERAQFLREVKDQPCADCGGRFHYCQMQFDHVRGKKEINLAMGTYSNGMPGAGSVSLKRLLAEIEKCDVVCANCHAYRTWKTVHEQRYDASADDEDSRLF